MGETLARKLAKRALDAGHRPMEKKMSPPLSIQGVGNGSQQCIWEMECPVAIPHADGDAHEHSFKTPIVTGAGKDLPGLLGLKSLEAQRAILDTAGKTLIIPGPGPVELNLPPGSLRIPLEKAPSGHLVMVVDEYHKTVQSQGGLKERTVHFLAGSKPADTPAAAASPTPEKPQR